MARRHDLVGPTDDPRPFFESCTYRRARSSNALGQPLPFKVAHRAVPDVDVEFGNHDARSPRLGPALDDGSVLLFHVPIRSHDQLVAKAIQGATAVDRTPGLDPDVCKTWRALRALHQRGELRAFYEAQTVDPGNAEARLRSGELIRDTRLRDRLARCAVPPRRRLA